MILIAKRKKLEQVLEILNESYLDRQDVCLTEFKTGEIYATCYNEESISYFKNNGFSEISFNSVELLNIKISMNIKMVVGNINLCPFK